MDNGNTKQKIIIQAVCILLSIGLWFYVTNSENPSMINDLNRVPVEILNTDTLKDSNLILAPNQNFYVNLKIEGSTQDLRKISKNDFKIQIDLSEYALRKGENKIPVNIVDQPSRINIKNTSGLAIIVIIDEYVEKEIPVQSNIEIIAQPNYYVAPPTFNPSVVYVSGPKSLVDNVVSATAQGQEANVSETIVKNYTINPLDANGNVVEGVELSQGIAEATINVNNGKQVSIRVNTIGALKEGIKLKAINLEVSSVQISGPAEVLDTISELTTNAIDLSTVNGDTSVDLIINVPSGVQINLADNKITANVSVEKIASKDLEVPFTLVGVQSGLIVKPKAEVTKVRVYGYQEDLDKIIVDNIKVELNVSSHNEAGTFSESPTVTIVNSTADVTVESLEKISYDITKEEEPPTE